MKYFVSYTTLDEEVTMELLTIFSNQLKKIGDVFIDILDNKSLNKQDRVLFEIDNCDVLILIETKNTYKSEWVSLEIDRAITRQIPIKKISIADILSYQLTSLI
jgi:4-hydroxy-3-methylbut-2-enyl diphosphate reductase IspH